MNGLKLYKMFFDMLCITYFQFTLSGRCRKT
jgi:hypothetical protein